MGFYFRCSIGIGNKILIILRQVSSNNYGVTSSGHVAKLYLFWLSLHSDCLKQF